MKCVHLACLIFLICSCTNKSPWAYQNIDTQDDNYIVSKLKYVSDDKNCPIQFEIYNMNEELASYIHLSRSKLSSKSLTIAFHIEDLILEEPVDTRSGNMRIRLSSQITQTLIEQLKMGKTIEVFIDGFKQTLNPFDFESSFAKLNEKKTFLQNLYLGPK